MNARKEYNELMTLLRKTTLTEQEFVEVKRLVTKRQLSLARTTATSFGIAAIVVLIAFVYGFVTNAALNKQQESALYYKEKAEYAEARITQMEAQIKASLAAAADAGRALEDLKSKRK